MPPKVDINVCEGIGACVETCWNDVFELEEDRRGNLKAHVVHPENCGDCGRCVTACRLGAIELPYTLVTG